MPINNTAIRYYKISLVINAEHNNTIIDDGNGRRTRHLQFSAIANLMPILNGNTLQSVVGMMSLFMLDITYNGLRIVESDVDKRKVE
jgi:hypothetical protein